MLKSYDLRFNESFLHLLTVSVRRSLTTMSRLLLTKFMNNVGQNIFESKVFFAFNKGFTGNNVSVFLQRAF